MTGTPCRICGSLEDHRGIGGSMIAAVLGQSKWNTPLDAYLILRGNLEVTETSAMEEGHYLEEPLLRWYSEKHDRSAQLVRRQDFLRHPELPWLVGHVDARYRNAAGDEWFADAKSVNWRAVTAWGDAGTDEVPLDAFWQGHSYLWLDPSAHKIDFVARLGVWPPRVFTLTRDDELFEMVKPKLIDFWKHVEEGVPPEPDYADDKTLNSIKSLYPPHEEKTPPVELLPVVDLGGDRVVRLEELCEAYEVIGKRAKELESLKKRIEAALRVSLGTAKSGKIGSATINRIFNRGGFRPATTIDPYDYLKLNFPKGYEMKLTISAAQRLIEGETNV